MLRLEADPEKTDTVVGMVGAVAADLEAHEAATVVVVAGPWVLLLHLEIGDAARGRVRTVAEVVVASEVAEVVTKESLHNLDVLLAI